MPLISVRELHQRATKVLQRVRKEKARYIITYQGHPIALFLPVDPEAEEAAMIKASKQSVSVEHNQAMKPFHSCEKYNA